MSLGHGAKVVRGGLVFHLDAANPKSYPGSGTTWYDLSGNGNHATIYSGVTFGQNGFTADAIGEGIKVSFPQQTKWTLSLWFKKNATGGTYSRIAGSGPTMDSGEIAILGDTITFNGPAGGWTNTSSTIVNGETINLVTSFDTDSLTVNNTFVYKNSVNILTQMQTVVETQPTTYMFMARNDFNSEWLPSTIYSASLYSRILTSSEISQNYQATRRRYGI